MRRSVVPILACTIGIVVAAGSVGANPRADARAAKGAAADSDEIALGAALVVQFDKDRGVAATPQTQRIEAYLQRIADS